MMIDDGEMMGDDALRTHFDPFLFQTSDDIHLLNVLLEVACQNVQVVFRNSKATVSEYLLESNHRTAHGRPLLSECMPEPMDTRLFQSPFVAVVPNGMITTASGELFPIDGAEKPIFHTPATVLEVFLKDFDDVLIQWDNQGLAVLCGIHIDHRVIKIHVSDFDIHQTVLPDASREQKVDNHPTAVGGEDTLADIGLFQEFAQFLVCIGLDGSLVCFWKLYLKVREILAFHKEPHQRFQIPCVGSHGNLIQIRVIPQGNVEVRHGLLVHGGNGRIGRDSLVNLLD